MTSESDEVATSSLKNEDDETDLIGRVWYQHGLFCATHPRLVILSTALVIFICSAPLFSVPLFGGLATIEWITLSPSGVSVADSRGQTKKMFQGNDTTIPKWFVGEPLLYVQQFVVTAHVSPWKPGLQTNEVVREALRSAFHITNFIRDFEHQQSGEYMRLSDVCLHVTPGPTIMEKSGLNLQDGNYLPASGCLLLSPANLWNQSMSSFENDFKVLDDLYRGHGRPAFNIALKEFIFGLPLKKTGIYPDVSNKQGRKEQTIRYAVTLMLTSHHQSYMETLGRQLQSKFPLAVSGAGSQSTEPSKGHVVHVYYKGEGSGGGYVEFFPVCVAYFIVFLYLAFSVSKIEMVKSKWGLAFSAVLTVVASLCMAAGLCSFFGLVPTLNSSEVLPYLVIVIGVENILVITKSVVSTPVDLDVKFRVAQGLRKEGRYILKNLFTEITILLSGYFTFVPAIQEFCLFAVVGLSTDFFLQMVFFATVLSIDIRRMDLSDLSIQRRLSQNVPGAKQVTSSGPSQQPAGLTSSSPLSWFKILPPLPAVSSSGSQQCPVMPRKLPKRLNFAYMWARTRIVQRALMVCAVLYFLYVVAYPGTHTGGIILGEIRSPNERPKDMSTEKLPMKQKTTHESSNSENASSPGGINTRRYRQEDDVPGERHPSEEDEKSVIRDHQKNGRAPFSFKPPSEEPWKSLYKRHWPQMLSYYDINLSGRYISILPPVHLGSRIDTEMIISKMKRDPASATPGRFKNSRDSIHEGSGRMDLETAGSGDDIGVDSGDRLYYLNAFYCLLLALFVMVLLFFLCKFLNECQISPKAYRKRRRTGMDLDELFESVPISLKGHRAQLCSCSLGNVEHVKCTMSFIVSVCLSGQIRIWDMSSGKCLREVHRNSSEGAHSPRQDRRSRRRVRRKILTADNGGYTKHWFHKLDDGFPQSVRGCNEGPSPDQSTSGLESFTQSPCGAENGASVASGLESQRSCSIESVNSNYSGYDFEPFASGVGLGTWSPRLNSHSSSNSSLPSDSEEGDLMSSSEVSLEDKNSIKSGSVSCYHGNGRPVPAVWCVDCQEYLLAAGCSDGTVEVWNISSGRQLDVFADSHQGVTIVSFLPKTTYIIVVARLDGTLDVVSLGVSSGHLSASTTEGSPVRRSSPRNTRKIPSQGPESVGASSTEHSTVTTPTVCTLLHRVSAHHQPINFLCVTEGWLITGSRDRTLKVFRTADQFVCRFTLHGHRAGITALSLDETNPNLILSGAENGGVRVWDFITGECLQHLRGHVTSVTAVTCTATHLMSVSLDSVTCIWLRARGVCLHRIRQFPDLYSNVAMLSRNLFVTGGRGCIQVWNLLSGKRVRSIPLGDDASVFVRRVCVRDNATVVCDYGKELRMVSFPGIINKAE